MKLQTDGKGKSLVVAVTTPEFIVLSPMACRSCRRLMVQITEAALNCKATILA
jgi:hypothetical protein